MSQEEWGPWIEHDGMGCPCEGKYVQAVFDDGTVYEGIAGGQADEAIKAGFDPFVSWKWAVADMIAGDLIAMGITHFRIRKLRALQELKERIATLPEEVNA